MPRPLSVTVTASPPLCRVTVIVSAWPLRYSSTELSTISQTRWCSPSLPTSPMYIAGRSRTGSRSFRTLISDPLYQFDLLAVGVMAPLFRCELYSASTKYLIHRNPPARHGRLGVGDVAAAEDDGVVLACAVAGDRLRTRIDVPDDLCPRLEVIAS